MLINHPSPPSIPTNMESEFYKIDNIENKIGIAMVSRFGR